MPVARPAAAAALMLAAVISLTGCAQSVVGSIIEGLTSAGAAADDLTLEEAQGLFMDTVCPAERNHATMLDRLYGLPTGSIPEEFDIDADRALRAASESAGLIEQHAPEWPPAVRPAMNSIQSDHEEIVAYWQQVIEARSTSETVQIRPPQRNDAAVDEAVKVLELESEFDRCRPTP